MTKHFEFADFVEEFKVKFTLYEQTPGAYNDNGKWIEGTETPREVEGIILPASPSIRRNDPNGTSEEITKNIYTVFQLKKGQKIEFEGKTLIIDTEKAYSEYADVYIYTAKGGG